MWKELFCRAPHMCTLPPQKEAPLWATRVSTALAGTLGTVNDSRALLGLAKPCAMALVDVELHAQGPPEHQNLVSTCSTNGSDTGSCFPPYLLEQELDSVVLEVQVGQELAQVRRKLRAVYATRDVVACLLAVIRGYLGSSSNSSQAGAATTAARSSSSQAAATAAATIWQQESNNRSQAIAPQRSDSNNQTAAMAAILAILGCKPSRRNSPGCHLGRPSAASKRSCTCTEHQEHSC